MALNEQQKNFAGGRSIHQTSAKACAALTEIEIAVEQFSSLED